MTLVETETRVFLIKAADGTASYETSEVVALKKNFQEAEEFIAKAKESEQLKRNYWLVSVPLDWDEEESGLDELPTLQYPAYRLSEIENTTVEIEE